MGYVDAGLDWMGTAWREGAGVDFGPDAAQDQHAEVEDDLESVTFPAHSRELDPLREECLAGGLGHAAADGQPRVTERVIPHPDAASPQVRAGRFVCGSLGFVLRSGPRFQRRGRVQDPVDGVRFLFQHPAHAARPGCRRGLVQVQGFGDCRQPRGRMVVVHHPLPPQTRLRHRVSHAAQAFGVERFFLIARIADIRQLRERVGPLPQDLLQQSQQFLGHRLLAEFRSEAQRHGSQPPSPPVMHRNRCAGGHLEEPVGLVADRDPVTAYGQRGLAASLPGKGPLEQVPDPPGLHSRRKGAVASDRLESNWRNRPTPIVTP